MDIASAFRQLGQSLTESKEPLSLLNQELNRILGWPFKVGTGSAIDSDGNRSEQFGSIIYAGTSPDDGFEAPVLVSADSLAAVLDLCSELDLESFRNSYQRIVNAKRLKKTPPTQIPGYEHTTTTLGILLAQRSNVSLEELAGELTQLNEKTPSAFWPDLVAVQEIGVINYAAQLPGDEIMGDFLPPAQNAVKGRSAPPVYVLLLMHPTGEYTFNKACAFLLAHLAIFSPGANLPKWNDVLTGTPSEAITVCGYQYNLGGELAAVPRQFYNDRYLPQLPLRIEGGKSDLLGLVQFLPWQDGGVILLTGKFPLEGLLVFGGKDALKGQLIKRPGELQMSYVLPITEKDFRDMLGRFQNQSNMRIRAQTPSWVMQKFADEGSTSPVIARLFMGVLRLREMVFHSKAERDRFDEPYELVRSALWNTRSIAKEIGRIWDDHARKVTEGEVARVQGRSIRVDVNVDGDLKKEVEAFLNSAVRTLKHAMQQLTMTMGVDIGFLFKKESTFLSQLTALDGSDPLLAAYLRETRLWSERLINARNAIEHEGWTLPRVKYSQEGDHVRVTEPEIAGQAMSSFATDILDRLCCFIEEITAHCLQRKMPHGVTITEIPLTSRVQEAPERFRVTPFPGGLPVWKLTNNDSPFDQT